MSKRYRIALTIEVDAFDDDDALDAIQDAFGAGENAPGIIITDCEVEL